MSKDLDMYREEDKIICRHPLTYILESADDIAYLTADLEDALKKGLFDVNSFQDYCLQAIDSIKMTNIRHAEYTREILEELKNYVKQHKENKHENGNHIPREFCGRVGE